MPGNIKGTGKVYLKVVGGNFSQTVEKTTQGAKLREYELSNGKKGSKWEITYQNWTGRLVGIKFEDTEYGKMCRIELDDAVVTLGADSRYFTDFASKIFNADLTKLILFHPYDMEVDGGKKRQGISLQQGGQKLQSYFYNPETKKKLHGFPEVDEAKKAKYGDDYWKPYFTEVKFFLMEQLEALKIPAPIEKRIEEVMTAEDVASDLPF